MHTSNLILLIIVKRFNANNLNASRTYNIFDKTQIFRLISTILFEKLIVLYLILFWKLYFCLGCFIYKLICFIMVNLCWMLYFCSRMLYYASKFSILGLHVDQSPLHILIFYLSFEKCFIHKSIFSLSLIIAYTLYTVQCTAHMQYSVQ